MRLQQAIKEVRASVVQMSTIDAATRTPRVIGSGFLVGTGRHVVTAKHVVDAVPVGSLSVGLAGPEVTESGLRVRGSFVYQGCRLVAENGVEDVALLELDWPPEQTFIGTVLTVDSADGSRKRHDQRTRPIRVVADLISEGLEVATSGFPLAAPSLVTTAGIVASTFGPLNPEDPDSGIRHLCDLTAVGGNSGGPVYRVSDAAVVGVLVAGRLSPVLGGAGRQSVGLTLVTPADIVVKLMESFGVEPAHAAGPPQKPSRNKKKR